MAMIGQLLGYTAGVSASPAVCHLKRGPNVLCSTFARRGEARRGHSTCTTRSTDAASQAASPTPPGGEQAPALVSQLLELIDGTGEAAPAAACVDHTGRNSLICP